MSCCNYKSCGDVSGTRLQLKRKKVNSRQRAWLYSCGDLETLRSLSSHVTCSFEATLRILRNQNAIHIGFHIGCRIGFHSGPRSVHRRDPRSGLRSGPRSVHRNSLPRIFRRLPPLPLHRGGDAYGDQRETSRTWTLSPGYLCPESRWLLSPMQLLLLQNKTKNVHILSVQQFLGFPK